MTKQGLLEMIRNMPDTAVIYIEGDHGQRSQQAMFVHVTTDIDLYYDGEDIDWSHDVESVDINSITAILIS